MVVVVYMYFLRSRLRVCKFLVTGLHHCPLVRQDCEGLHSRGGGGLVGGDSDRFNVIGVPAVDYLVEGLFFVFFIKNFLNISQTIRLSATEMNFFV